MKNRLSALAAGTAICAVLAAPATAGYTIYEDTEMPSVLFIEFDTPEGGEPTVISAPAGRAAAPVVIGGSDSSDDNDDDQGHGGGTPFADDASADSDDQPSFEQQMDDALAIDSDRVRDAVMDEVIRDQLFNDSDLR